MSRMLGNGLKRETAYDELLISLPVVYNIPCVKNLSLIIA